MNLSKSMKTIKNIKFTTIKRKGLSEIIFIAFAAMMILMTVLLAFQ